MRIPIRAAQNKQRGRQFDMPVLTYNKMFDGEGKHIFRISKNYLYLGDV